MAEVLSPRYFQLKSAWVNPLPTLLGRTLTEKGFTYFYLQRHPASTSAVFLSHSIPNTRFLFSLMTPPSVSSIGPGRQDEMHVRYGPSGSLISGLYSPEATLSLHSASPNVPRHRRDSHAPSNGLRTGTGKKGAYHDSARTPGLGPKNSTAPSLRPSHKVNRRGRRPRILPRPRRASGVVRPG